MPPKKKLVILGSSGMLGKELVRRFFERSDFAVIALSRNEKPVWDASKQDISEVLRGLELNEKDRVINASGWIPQRAAGTQREQIRAAELMNVQVVKDLDSACSKSETPLLQIGTDCVFDGLNAPYYEDSKQDATDLYGRTKISGEESLRWANLVRCSIIGDTGPFGLLGWFLARGRGSEVVGYVDATWNGVSTIAFSNLANAWVDNTLEFSPVQHWIPADYASKFQLLGYFSDAFNRQDIVISPARAPEPRDLRLATHYATQNENYWSMAGYNQIPSIEEMVREFVARRAR
ncbi:sugar nucleotide-binding protein [Aquiluna sp.]|nr:sugar nucleotide-binding protein [Aquiluna sp.]